jgi:signal transduction histidine kinase
VSSAVAAVLLALLLRWLLEPILHGEAPFLLLFAAVMAAAAYGGLWPGLLATILGGGAATLLFGSPTSSSAHYGPELLLYIIEGVLLSIVGARLHRAASAADTAQRANLELEQQILEISDDERRRIGHDLHDGLGQQLTGIALLSKVLQQRLAGGSAREAQTAEQIASLVNQSIAWTRDLARGLAPVALDSGGLSAAMEEAAYNSARILQVNCTFFREGPERRMDPHHSVHLYRIIQEAMSNSVKHGKARNIEVRLRFDEHSITLTVIDDGCGISFKTLARPGLGLQIMRYRARMIGATIRIQRASADSGTIVHCILPTGSKSPAGA